MPDLNNTDLVSFKGWTLRVRVSPDRFGTAESVTQREPSPRLLLLIHGLSGDENSMWVFARDLSPNYWIVAPRAPHAATPSGYSWRPPQYDDLNQLDFDLLRASAEALIRLVDEYSASVGVDASTFDAMGFSQGAAMCNVLTFLYPERIRKVGILAGFVPHGLDGLISQRPLEGKPFFVVHGTKDQMVPIDLARASIEILERAGAKVTYCEDEVGHKVSITCLRSLKKFFTDTQSTPRGGSLD
jgi:phospholipase/carboxylesterase